MNPKEYAQLLYETLSPFGRSPNTAKYWNALRRFLRRTKILTWLQLLEKNLKKFRNKKRERMSHILQVVLNYHKAKSKN